MQGSPGGGWKRDTPARPKVLRRLFPRAEKAMLTLNEARARSNGLKSPVPYGLAEIPRVGRAMSPRPPLGNSAPAANQNADTRGSCSYDHHSRRGHHRRIKVGSNVSLPVAASTFWPGASQRSATRPRSESSLRVAVPHRLGSHYR